MKNKGIKVRDLRNGDWYWVHKRVIERYGKKIGAIGLALYNVYCYYSNKEGRAFPSIETISKKLNISKQTVYRYNNVLVKHGLIQIESGRGRKKVNEVYLLKINVNLRNKKVNLREKKVSEVDTEQELLTRINNNKGLNFLRKTLLKKGILNEKGFQQKTN